MPKPDMSLQKNDQLVRFLFDGLAIRGELVRMEASWLEVLHRYPYPAVVAEQLGQALAATLLLAATIKFEGSMILQAQGAGPIRTLVAQATHDYHIRGLAHWDGEPVHGPLPELYGEGRLAITVDPRKGKRYQGIVSLQGESIATALQEFFRQSEQLPTRLWLVANGRHAIGLLLQKMPSPEADPEDWERIQLLADTITDRELFELAPELLLHRLFHEEEVRLFEPDFVAFRCGCSHARIEETLQALGESGVRELLEEQGEIRVDCEFCNRNYRFDRVDVERLFSPELVVPGTRTQH